MSRPFTPATTLRQRGFYSDLPAVSGNGAGKKAGGGQKISLSTRHNAVNPQVVPPSKSFAPDLGDWDPHPTSGAAAAAAAVTPRKASEPKVQLPYVCAVGEVPRKIEIERRKRAYAQMDVTVLLEMKWLRPGDLLPGGDYLTDEIPADGASFLPLECFDDTECVVMR